MPQFPALSSYLTKKPEPTGIPNTQTSTPPLLAKPIIPQIVDFAQSVPSTVQKAGLAIKDFATPGRGFTDTQIQTAKPTLGEKFKGLARSGAEIVSGLTTIGQGILRSLPIPQPKNDSTLVDKIKDFSIPKTAGEAKVMRLADIAGFLPIGSVKNYGKVVDTIAKSKNADEITTLLQKTGVAKETIPTLAKTLTGVDNPRRVNSLIEGFDTSSQILKPKPFTAKPVIPEALQQKQTALEIQKDLLSNDPAKQLEKYASKQGDFSGGLKEVTGTGTKFAKQGDEFAQQAGFTDSEQAREAFLKYQEKKQNVGLLEKEVKQEVANWKKAQKTIHSEDKIKKVEYSSNLNHLAENYASSEDKINKLNASVYGRDAIDPLTKSVENQVRELEDGQRSVIRQLATKLGISEGGALEAVGRYVDIGERRGKRTIKDFYDNIIDETPKGKPTEKLSKSLGNSIENRPVGVREKSLEYFRNNPSEITKTPINIRTVNGKQVIEDGRHRLQVVKELKKEVVTKDVSSEYFPKKISAEGIPLALTKKERGLLKTPSADSTLSHQTGISRGEAKSIEIQAEQARSIAKGGEIPSGVSLPKIIANTVTPVKNRVHIIDTYLRTPDRVMEKIGFGQEAKQLRTAMDGYWKELPKNIKKIEEWQKAVPKESNVRIFKFLDGQAIDLRPEEQKVADEIKTWLSEWASRLKLGSDNRISDYITHIFDKEFQQGGFDEELAKIITDKIPGSVYNPFTLKRLGAKGYKQDTWQALDAYVKRGTRKVHLDPVLENIQAKAGSSLDVANVEKSQYQFIQKYISNINMRPTDLDESIDNVLRSAFGNRFGQRPVTAITKFLRQLTFRGMLGLNPGSALRNLSQGINTYATLGEKYTTIGYAGIFKKGAIQELEREGVLSAGFIQDKVLSATRKKIQQADKVLFAFFDGAERINRGSAYFGAKAKGISLGYSEEKAIEYAKSIVRKTQFVFDSVDTPVGMGSDIAKTLFQFQTFTTKQIEFLTEMAKDKNFVGLLRYAVAGTAFVYTVGKAFGMEPKELVPWYRFDTPPSLKFPVEVTKALVDAPDKYGNQRDISKKLNDVGKSAIGLIPAGTQAKKTIEGTQAVRQGKSTDAAGRAQFDVGGTKAKDIQAFLFGKYAGGDAKAYFDGKKYAESQYEKLLKSPTKKEDWVKIVKEDPNLAKAIARVKEKIDLGITPEDDKILALGVQNKARAKFVADKVKSLKTKEEKKALIVEYIKKKIITDEVSNQLLEMLK